MKAEILMLSKTLLTTKTKWTIAFTLTGDGVDCRAGADVELCETWFRSEMKP